MLCKFNSVSVKFIVGLTIKLKSKFALFFLDFQFPEIVKLCFDIQTVDTNTPPPAYINQKGGGGGHAAVKM